MEKQETVAPSSLERQTEPLWKYEDVAEYLGVKVSTVRNDVKVRGLPIIRIGGRSRFRKTEIDAWLDRQSAA